MPRQHMLDEALGDGPVVRMCAIAEHYVIDHREGRDQLGTGALGQQWVRGVGYLDCQGLAGGGAFTQPSGMLGQERVEVAGQPEIADVARELAGVFEGDDF